MTILHSISVAALFSASLAPSLVVGAQETARSAKAGPTLPEARYVVPAPGTREIFSNFENTLGKARGRWRVPFTTGQKTVGMRTGLFVPDNSERPLELDETRIAQLWPLRVGKKVELVTRQAPRRWTWQFEVVGTERVSVRAGEFDTYVVTASETQKTVVKGDPPITRLYTFWYAPSLGTIVRLRSMTLREGQEPLRTASELVRLERPNRSPVGADLR